MIHVLQRCYPRQAVGNKQQPPIDPSIDCFCLFFSFQLPSATRLHRDTGNWSYLPQPLFLLTACAQVQILDTLTSPPIGIPPGDSCKRRQKGLLLQPRRWSILPLPRSSISPQSHAMRWTRCCEDGPAFPSHLSLQFGVQVLYTTSICIAWIFAGRSMQRRTYRSIHNARNLAPYLFLHHPYQRPNPPPNATTARPTAQTS